MTQFLISPALCSEPKPAEAIWLTDRQLLLVNLTFGDGQDRVVTLTVTCSNQTTNTETHKTSSQIAVGFSLSLPVGCENPILDISEVKQAPNSKDQVSLKILPQRVAAKSPASQGSQNTWIGPILGALIALMSALLTAFLGARWTYRRERAKATFDLRRSFVENEITACNMVLHICREQPNLDELQAAFLVSRSAMMAESEVMAAFDRLRGRAASDGGLNRDHIEDFAQALRARRDALLARDY